MHLRPHRSIIEEGALAPLHHRFRIKIVAAGELLARSLRSLYSSSDGVRGLGAAVKNLSHRASRNVASAWLTPRRSGTAPLVFSIGLQFHFRWLIRLASAAALVALIQSASMIGLGYLVGRLMGWTQWESLLTGAIVSISGAVIVARAFEEVKVDSRVRDLVFGVVLCEDVIAILLLA